MIHDVPAAAFLPLAAVLGAYLLVSELRHDRLARVLTVLGLLLIVLRYLAWRMTATLDGPGIGPADRVFILTFFAVELLGLFDGLVLALMMSRRRDNSPEADRHEARLRAADPRTLPAVDVLIATYNEPLEVLERTILCARALDWPDVRVWVCDDGRRAWLARYCAEKGVGYLTRPDNRGAKAGNINAALARTSAPFVLVLDADFAPRRNMLYRMMGFFEDPRVGIVQAPHAFYNPDPMQQNLALHRVLPDDQRLFFDEIMPCRDAWDAAFCCGSNGILRRSAIAEIGGRLPEGSITEDMLTTLVLLRRGHVTRYLNEKLALGLAPESTAAFFVQRARWARGAIQILFLRHGPLGPGLSFLHRLFFLPTHWISGSLVQAFALLAPLVFMFTGIVPIANLTLVEVLQYQIPTVVALFAAFVRLSQGAYQPLPAVVLSAFSCVRLLPAVLWTFVRPFGHPFRVTPKGRDGRAANRDDLVLTIAATILLATIVGLLINATVETQVVDRNALIPIVSGWAVYNAVVLVLVGVMATGRPPQRAEERFDMGGEAAQLRVGDRTIPVSLVDLSLGGAFVRPDQPLQTDLPARVTVALRNVPPLQARLVGQRNGGFAFAFTDVSDAAREALILRLLSEHHRPALGPERRRRIAAELLARIFLPPAPAKAA
ncbi:glycosyltransferase [Elioraea thermophila]|uniref:glycosyltransferase n=1 Tax=Elioraea thermophila TaxID=2185104 RepID=UPI000DF2C72A|nr:glycosyltransferase [Elioraea thermophila]